MYLYDVKWTAKTAGPSPEDNKRTELFLFGCQRAVSGNPCPQCFNSQIWKVPENAKTYASQEVADNLIKYSRKYLTIGGGEPLDQIDELIEVCRLIKPYDFNILIYTWRSIEELLNDEGDIPSYKILELAKNINGFIDGPFIYQEKVYKESLGDGFLNSIGSSNQHVVLTSEKSIVQYQVKDIENFIYENGLIVKSNKVGEVLWKL